MDLQATIVAISSAVGPAGRMIVRMSGDRAVALLAGLTAVADPAGGSVHKTSLKLPASRLGRVGREPATFDVPVIVYVFRAPRSYTAEDLVELHLPGNPLLARLVVDELVSRGARLAGPGEFTARAFLNGRLDLSKAEGVGLSIAAGSEAELRSARQLMAGELARRLTAPMDEITATLALLEAGIDFSEEDISFIDAAQLKMRIDSAASQLRAIVSESSRFERASHTPRFVLAGAPNAGKSTLLNALAGHERAVVSPVAGTTRDVLAATVALASGFVEVLDVAGFERASSGASALAEIEQQMQQRARRHLDEADFVIHVIDAAHESPRRPLPRAADIVVLNKADMSPAPLINTDETGAIRLSALTGHNLEALRQRMDTLAFGQRDRTSTLALNSRHLAAIDEANASLARAAALVNESQAAPELIAAELRSSLDALGNILGHVTPDDVLGQVFSTFCIGK